MKDLLMIYAAEECRKALDRTREELPVYIINLIKVARKADFEERYGSDSMRELIRQGIYHHIENIGKEERESHELLEDARKLLNL